MRRPTIVVSLLVSAQLLAPMRPYAADAPTTTPDGLALTVRLYAASLADVPADAALRLASALLRDAGIGSRWVVCGPDTAAAICVRPLSSSELAMRFVHAAMDVPAGAPVAMGSSLVDTSRHTGVLATLYLDRITRLAAASETAVDVVLARAMAHEAAHLVLGTNEHGTAGLMRPLWSREMLRTEPESQWAFTATESARLRAALGKRAGGGR